MGNQVKTFFLLAALTMFLMFIGRMLGGNVGMGLALVLAIGMNFFSYWYSDKIVLKMYKAEQVDERSAPKLYRTVRNLAQRAQLPMPKVYIIPEESPNAFATGRNPDNAVVAVTEGLLRLMNDRELEGVLAHELGHVHNRDILIGTIAATMAGAIMMLASMAKWGAIFGFGDDDDNPLGFVGILLIAILAPIGAMIIQMAISRTREYKADATGARFAGSPEGLARALEKLSAQSGRVPMHASEAGTKATAHMFIVNPLSAQALGKMFSTHPPARERIAKLRGERTSSMP